MNLFGLKNCDTCRKALKEIKNVTFVDVRTQGVPLATLQQAFTQFEDALVNKRSTTWRELNESERARPVLELFGDYPTLMKRPLIEHDGALYLGWTATTRAALGVA